MFNSLNIDSLVLEKGSEKMLSETSDYTHFYKHSLSVLIILLDLSPFLSSEPLSWFQLKTSMLMITVTLASVAFQSSC